MKKILSILVLSIVTFSGIAQDMEKYLESLMQSAQSAINDEDYAKARIYINEMDAIRDSVDKGSEEFFELAYICGLYHLDVNDEELGLQLLNEAKDYFEKGKNKRWLRSIYGAIGGHYYFSGDYEKACYFYQKSIKYTTKGRKSNATEKFSIINDSQFLARSLIQLGKAKEAERLIKKARKSLLKNYSQIESLLGKEYFKKFSVNNDNTFIYLYGLEAEYYTKKKDFAKVQKSIGKALEIVEDNHNISLAGIKEIILKEVDLLAKDGGINDAGSLIDKFVWSIENALEADGNSINYSIDIINILCNLADDSYNENLYEGMKVISDMAYDFSKQTNNTEVQARACAYKSICSEINDNLTGAIRFANERLSLIETCTPADSLSKEYERSLNVISFATKFIRYFCRKDDLKKGTEREYQVLDSLEINDVFNQWEWVLSHGKKALGEERFSQLLKQFDYGEEYRIFPNLSESDLELMKAHASIYFGDLDNGIQKLQQIIKKNNFTSQKTIEVIWRVDNNLYLNSSYADAVTFLNKIKPCYSDDNETSNWIDNEIRYLGNWVNENVAQAQEYESQKDTAAALSEYDRILSQVEKASGRDSLYADVLLSKAKSLIGFGQLENGLNDLEEVDRIINEKSFDSFSINIGSSIWRIIAEEKLKNYSAAINTGLSILSYLDSHTDRGWNQTYLSVLGNIIVDYSRINDYKNSDKQIKNAQSFISRCPSLKEEDIDSFYNGISNAYSVRLRNCISASDFANAERQLEESKVYMKTFKQFENVCLDIDYMPAFIKYEQAKGDFIDEILNYGNRLALKDTSSIDQSNLLEGIGCFCFEAGYAEKALSLYEQEVTLIKAHRSEYEKDKVAELYSYMSDYSQLGCKDWKSAIEYLYKAFLEEADIYGPESEKAKADFEQIHLVYDLSVATGISYLFKAKTDEYHPFFDYEGYMEIILKWREIIQEATDKFGYEYVKDCYNNYLNDTNKFKNDFDYVLDYYSATLMDECNLNISFSKISEFGNIVSELSDYMKSHKLRSAESIYLINTRFAKHLVEMGKADLAYYGILKPTELELLKDCDFISFEKYNEKLTTDKAELKWRMGDRDACLGILANPIQMVFEDECKWFFEEGQKEGYYKDLTYDQYREFIVNDYKDINELMQQLIVLSRIYYDEDRSKQVLDYAESLTHDTVKARLISKETLGTLYNDLATKENDLNKKIMYYEKSIENNPDWTIRMNLAHTLIQADKPDSAKIQLAEVDSMIHNGDYVGKNWMKEYDETRYLISLKEGRIDEARDYLKDYLETSQSDFYEKTQSQVSSSRSAYWDEHYTTTLFKVSEMERQLGEDASISYNAALFQKGILINLKDIIKKNILNSDDQKLKEAFKLYNENILSSSDSLDKVEKYMMLGYSLHPEFVGNNYTVSWEGVRSSLGEKDAAIEFTVLDEGDDLELYALVLKSRSKAPKFVQLCNYEELREYIEQKKDTAYALSGSKRNQLYDNIWKPLEKELKGISNIYFAPVGVLNSMNIEMLAPKSGAKAICEKFIVRRLSSTGEICSQEEDKGYTSATLYGNINYDNANVSMTQMPVTSDSSDFSFARGGINGWKMLSGTKREITDISENLQSMGMTCSIFEGEDASEETFKNLSKANPDIIHIATHGYYYSPASKEIARVKFFNPDENDKVYADAGTRSGLILSGANKAWKGNIVNGQEDGILTAGEIEGMDLRNTQLLVLSACQTALGDSGSDGVYGIQRSFKIAGVKTIIMSLWYVNDAATQKMMSECYSNLSKGMEVHDAFTKATLTIKALYPDDPDFWASFIMLD